MFFFFFFNDTATTEIYTLSLHDALPICTQGSSRRRGTMTRPRHGASSGTRSGMSSLSGGFIRDRKSTRLNSSHSQISYAVFCLKKKKHLQGGLSRPSRQEPKELLEGCTH